MNGRLRRRHVEAEPLGQGTQGFGRTAAAGPEGGQVFPHRLLRAVGALAVGLKRRTLDQQESDLPGCFVSRARLRIFEQFGQGDCEEAPQRSGFIVGQRIHQIGRVQDSLSMQPRVPAPKTMSAGEGTNSDMPAREGLRPNHCSCHGPKRRRACAAFSSATMAIVVGT